MVAAEDVVNLLIEKTECGDMPWRENNWEEDEGGAPKYWVTEWHDCLFGAGE